VEIVLVNKIYSELYFAQALFDSAIWGICSGALDLDRPRWQFWVKQQRFSPSHHQGVGGWENTWVALWSVTHQDSKKVAHGLLPARCRQLPHLSRRRQREPPAAQVGSK